MVDKFVEWAAAQKDGRFKLYREARLRYEAYLAAHPVPFERLTEEDYRRADSDEELDAAQQGYSKAIELTRISGKPRDVGIALQQLGMLLHLRKKFPEAREAF